MTTDACEERMNFGPRYRCQLRPHSGEHLAWDWRYAYAWEGVTWAMRWPTRHPMLHDEGSGL